MYIFPNKTNIFPEYSRAKKMRTSVEEDVEKRRSMRSGHIVVVKKQPHFKKGYHTIVSKSFIGFKKRWRKKNEANEIQQQSSKTVLPTEFSRAFIIFGRFDFHNNFLSICLVSYIH